MRRLTLTELIGLRRKQSELTPEQQQERYEIENDTGGFLRYRYARFEEPSVNTRYLKPHTDNPFKKFYYGIRSLMTKW